MKKSLFSFLLAMVLCLATTAIPAYASDLVGGGMLFTEEPAQGETSGLIGPSRTPEEVLGLDRGDAVTTDDVNDWVIRKGDDIIKVVTNIVLYASILGFFLSIGYLIIGIANKRSLAAGFIGLIVSCCAFTMATCAPQIIHFVSSWLQQ